MFQFFFLPLQTVVVGLRLFPCLARDDNTRILIYYLSISCWWQPVCHFAAHVCVCVWFAKRVFPSIIVIRVKWTIDGWCPSDESYETSLEKKITTLIHARRPKKKKTFLYAMTIGGTRSNNRPKKELLSEDLLRENIKYGYWFCQL